MSSATPQSESTNPACDLCHSRKVKCDRNNPCGNCLDANVSCRRVRSKHPQPRNKPPPKPSHEEVKRLTDRVAYLEGLVQPGDMPRRCSTARSAGSLDSHTVAGDEKKKDGSSYGSKDTVTESNGLGKRRHSLDSKDEPFPKKHQMDPGISPLESIRPMSTPQSPSTIEAQVYIQQELDATKDLSSTRRTVLKSAMEFINQLSERPKVTIGTRKGFSCGGTALQDIHYPTIEFLFWMLKEISSNSMGFHVAYFFKHVSPKSLERMGTALLHQQEDDETLLLYSICVNSLAAKFLNTILQEETNADMVKEVSLACEKYRTSTQLAMGRIHLLASPSLTLLQALLCSAFISQGAGDTSACWTFTSAACKACMDLGINTGRGDFWDIEAEDNELYYCFVWCYILDKSISMNLGRRTFLLDTDLINGSESVWASGRTPVNLLTVYLELSRMQSVVVSELGSRKTEKQAEDAHKPAAFARLLQQMHVAKRNIDELDQGPTKFRGLYMDSEIHALEFSYYSVMTAIQRCESASTGGKTSVGEDCVEAARSAIASLRSLQRSHVVGNEWTRLSFVNWTLLFYPLTPFFVLFCNVVANSNHADFALMKSMTDELSDLAALSTSIKRLQRLFTVFLSLAEPLLEEGLEERSSGAGDNNDENDSHTTTTTTTTTKKPSRTNNNTRTNHHHRRHPNSNGQALDMYFALKESAPARPSSFSITPAATRSSTRNHHQHHPKPSPTPTSAPAPASSHPPPWAGGGAYTSTFHLSELATPSAASAPATGTAAAAAVSPAPSSTTGGGSYAMNFSLPPEGAGGYEIPFWELFDVQPSLDWLDVDLGGMPGVMMMEGGQWRGGGGDGGA